MQKILVVLVCFLSFKAQAFSSEPELKGDQPHQITIEIKIRCPMSESFEEFLRVIPQPGHSSTSFDEWKASFVNSMNRLIHLVETEKTHGAFWSVKIDEESPEK